MAAGVPVSGAAGIGAPSETVTVIHAGTLIAEAGKAARRNVSVVVRGRMIAEVRDGFVDVPGARVVDLRNATVLPGLIDSHVHVMLSEVNIRFLESVPLTLMTARAARPWLRDRAGEG